MGSGGWISSTTIKPHDWFQCWSRRRICEEWFFQIWRDVMARGCESRGSKIWPDMVSSFPRAILCVQWPLSYGKQRGFRSWHSMSRWCVKEQSKIGSFALKMDPVWIAFTRTSGWVDQLQSDEAALTTIIEHLWNVFGGTKSTEVMAAKIRLLFPGFFVLGFKQFVSGARRKGKGCAFVYQLTKSSICLWIRLLPVSI